METRTDPGIQKQMGYWKEAKANNGRGMRTEQTAFNLFANFDQIAQSIRSRPRNEKTPYTGSQIELDWDHRHYWIAQIFEDKWQAHPTYQREVVPGKK